MKKSSSPLPKKGLSKRVRNIGIGIVGLFFACCLLTFAFSNTSNNKTKLAGEKISSKQAVSSLPSFTFVPSSTTVVKETNTIVPTATFTTIPAATNTPIPTQTQSKLSDCLPDNAKVETAKVLKVVDGDTIEVNINGAQYTIRYIGIDSPETNDPNASVQPFGPEAANRNTELVEDKEVSLVKDSSEADQNNRLLRYVFVDGLFVNEVLVKEGFAQAMPYPPDTSCNALFQTAQEEAKKQAIGQWSLPLPATKVEFVPTLAPSLPPGSEGCPQGCMEQKPGCDIKGNINSSGEKIYHVPSSSSYSKTKIDPSNGERWFCTADEAVANGWRAPRN